MGKAKISLAIEASGKREGNKCTICLDQRREFQQVGGLHSPHGLAQSGVSQ